MEKPQHAYARAHACVPRTRARGHPFSIKLHRRVWVAIFAFSATPVQIGTWCVGSLVKACGLSKRLCKLQKESTELDHTRFRSEAYKPPRRQAHRTRRGRVSTHLAAPWPYCSFTSWLRSSRHEFQYVAQPTMTQHEAWPHQYPWMPSWPYYGPCPAPSMPAPAQSPLSDSRFTKLSSTEELDRLCTQFVPQQTKSNNTWAQGVFKNWLLCRNASKDPTIEKFPVDILQTHYETSVVDRALHVLFFQPHTVF